MMTEDECNQLIDKYTKAGWKIDRNDDEKLWFSYLEDEDHEWMRDYDKNTGRFTHMNGRQKVNLITSKEKAGL